MKLLLFTTVIFSGLVAGLLYSYSCSVNPGLKMLADAEYIKAMKSINIAIQNPLFFLTFMGLLVLFPVATFQLYNQQSDSLYLFIGAVVIYFIGVFAVTIFFNVPLNNQLAKFSLLTASEPEIALMRRTFEKPWNSFHSIRMAASIISFALCISFLLKQK